jgi:hypothetical protein
MRQTQPPKLDEFLSGLCRVSLEVLPFEGAMIVMLNREQNGFERFGGSGIFDLTKAQHFLGKTNLRAESDYFIPNEINRMLSNGRAAKIQSSPLTSEYSMPGAGRVGLVTDAEEAKKMGLQFEDIYKQGKKVNVPVLIPLYHLNGSRGNVIGLFLLNNLITEAEISADTRLLFPLLASTLGAFVISRTLSRRVEGEDKSMSVPSKEEFMKKITILANVAGKHSALKLVPVDSRESLEPDTALLRLAATVILAIILMGFMVGIGSKTAWTLLATLGGLGAGSFLIHEAQTTRRGSLSSIPLYVAGFVLIFEFILFVARITSVVRR